MSSEPPERDRRLLTGPDVARPASDVVDRPPEEGRPTSSAVPAGRGSARRPAPRSVAFGVSLVVLVAAIPALSWLGVHLIRDSRSGHFVTGLTDSRAPGYEALVEPTPTALVVEKDQQGKPIGLVLLALGVSGGGGSTMFIPLNTQVASPAFGVDRLAGAFSFGGQTTMVSQANQLLRIAFSDVVDVDTAGWAALTAPVAPIRIDNPDDARAGTVRFPAGALSLRSDQVGLYLEASVPGESELNRMNRHQLFWQAWLRAVGASSDPAAVPGEAKSGLGLYVRTLAQGPVRAEAFPVRSDPKAGSGGLLVADDAQLRSTVADMVPVPVPPTPGSRVTVRLLNGVDGRELPRSVAHRLVVGGASISLVGNDRRFGQRTTVYEYRDPERRKDALAMRAQLGGLGTLRENARAPDTVDVTVVVGADVLESAGAASGPNSAGPASPSITDATSSTRGSTGIGG